MLAAFGPGNRQVTRDHVLRAVYDTEGVEKPRWRLGRRLLYGLFSSLAGAAVGVAILVHLMGPST